MSEYEPMKWYKSEFAWLLISGGIILILIALSFIINLNPLFFAPPFAYMGYFVVKGIVYAWIINPYNAWKNKRKK